MDNVQHPSHYTKGNIEVIDYIRDKLTTEQFIGFCIGNDIKYVSRWQDKGGVEDLEKAAVYLDWAIERAKDGKKCRLNLKRFNSLFKMIRLAKGSFSRR